MSNFDPRSPSFVPPGATLAFGGVNFNYTEGNQTATTVLSGTISASTATSIQNVSCKGALFILDVTALPGSASTTVALKINTTSPRTANIATRAAISASGTYAFMVYPGISASAGGVASPLPRAFSVQLSLSTGATSKEVAFSLSMMRIE